MKNTKINILLLFLVSVGLNQQYLMGIEEIVIIEKPFCVQTVQGIIKSEAGTWDEDYAINHIVFKLVGPNNDCMLWLVKLDSEGRFKLKVPEGKYTFSIEVCGWDDVRGVIIVSKTADIKSRIEIVLGLS